MAGPPFARIEEEGLAAERYVQPGMWGSSSSFARVFWSSGLMLRARRLLCVAIFAALFVRRLLDSGATTDRADF